MQTYTFHASRANSYFHWSPWGAPPLTAKALADALAGAIVHQVIESPTGGYDVSLQLDRGTQHVALVEIEAALNSLGYDTAQATITTWATSMLETAFLGGAGGGAVGSASKDPLVMVAGALIGLFVGATVGSAMHRAIAIHRADRLHPFQGGWQLSEVPVPRSTPSQLPYSPYAQS